MNSSRNKRRNIFDHNREDPLSLQTVSMVTETVNKVDATNPLFATQVVSLMKEDTLSLTTGRVDKDEPLRGVSFSVSLKSVSTTGNAERRRHNLK